jgi:hypothetical protein
MGMFAFASTVVRSETGSDFQNRMLRSRRPLWNVQLSRRLTSHHGRELCLSDEGEVYGRKLIEAGVEVVATRYNATILANAAPTRVTLTQAANFLKNVFTFK